MVYSYCTETTYIYIYIQHCYIVHISTYIDNSNKLKKQRRKSSKLDESYREFAWNFSEGEKYSLPPYSLSLISRTDNAYRVLLSACLLHNYRLYVLKERRVSLLYF